MGAEDSIRKLKRKKSTHKKKDEYSEMGISQPAQKEGNSCRASGEEKKNKKKKKKFSAQLSEPPNMKDETLKISGGKKKSNKSRDRKSKRSPKNQIETEEIDTGHINQVEDQISDGEYCQSEHADDKLQKSRKKKRKNVQKIRKEGNVKDGASDQQNDFKAEDHFANFGVLNKGDTRRNSKTGKSKNPGKMKKKKQLVANDLSSDSFLEKTGEEKGGDDAGDEVYLMSSGDEDHSKGMKKWITDYYQSRPGLKVLQERIDDFIMAHEAKEEQARVEKEAQAAEGGWTVVVQQKGRKKTTDAESGIAVGSVAQAAVVDKLGKKKKKDVGIDFYRFQKREAHRNEVMMLQNKFEQDKKRIQQMRAARKFRPY